MDTLKIEIVATDQLEETREMKIFELKSDVVDEGDEAAKWMTKYLGYFVEENL